MSTTPNGTIPHGDARRHYEELVAGVDGIVWEVDARTFQFTFVSQHAERLLGYSLAEWYTPGFWVDHVHPDDRAWAPDFCLRAAREQRDHDFEYRMLAADGRTVWLHDIVRVVVEGGETTMLRGIMVDITDRKRAEAERQAHLWFLESLDRVNRAIQGTSDLDRMMSEVLDTVLTIFECDRAGLIHPCDPEAATCSVVMERTKPEYPGVGESPIELPVDSDIADVFRTVRSADRPVRFGPGSDHPLPPSTATRFSVQSQLATAVYPKTGQPYMFELHQCSRLGEWTLEEQRLFQEIGRRLGDALTSLLTLRSLRDREQKLDASQRMAQIGYFDYDLDANRASLSDEARRIFGLPLDEPLVDFTSWQLRWPKLVHPEDLPRVLESASGAIRTGSFFDHEYRVVRPDGEVRVVHSRADVTLHESGRPSRMFGTVQDITDRTHAENKLRLFRSLIDRANDAIEVIDQETGRFLDVNEKACQLHGYSREEYLDLSVYDVIRDMNREAWERRRQDLRRIGSDVVEAIHRRKDGSGVPVEVNVAHVSLDRDYLIAVVRDVTERKQAERALVESHSLLNAVVEGTSDAVFVKDLDGRYLMINSAGAAFLGKTVSEVIGKDDLELFPSDAAYAIMERDRGAIEDGGSRVTEEIVTAAGVTRVFLSTKTRYHDAQGKVIGLIGISREVTELKQLEGQLRQAQKMEAVGRLAGGVAHDFNNILTVINGNSELVARNLRADDPDRELLLEIQKSGKRAADLTSQLLAFSRQQLLQPQVISLNSLLGDLCTLLRRLLGEDVELTLVPGAALGLATVDPTLFEQAVINLAVNARDAMPAGGRLTIETSNVELGATVSAGHPEVHSGRYILLTASDSGHGMDEATQANIFEPFFTTKGPGKGTGLGLAMVYGFVKQSGGHIHVESEPGRGTTFRVYLPRAEASALAAERLPLESTEVSRGSETILVVEDDELVRRLALRILQSSGYTVLDAGSGEAAMSAARDHQGPIHLVLTDVVMPGMSGRQLSEAVVQIRPDAVVLFMSGYADEAVRIEGTIKPGAAFLQKPFSPLVLTHKVRELLDARAGRREGA